MDENIRKTIRSTIQTIINVPIPKINKEPKIQKQQKKRRGNPRRY